MSLPAQKYFENAKSYLAAEELFNPLNHFYIPAFHAHKVALDVHSLDISIARKVVLYFVYSFGGSWTAYALSGNGLPILDNLIALYSLIFVLSGLVYELAQKQQKAFAIYRYALAIADEWVKCRTISKLHIKFGAIPNNHALKTILLASLGGYGGGLWDYVFNISKQHKTSILDVDAVDFIWTSIAPNIWSSIVVSVFLAFKKDVVVATGVKLAIFLSILVRNIQDKAEGTEKSEKVSKGT